MKKNLLFVAASATLLFAACTSESGGPSSNISYDALKAAEQADVQTPITFGTFTPREAVTRIGTIGSVTDLRDHDGFGVFAYYTNGDYSSTTSIPNFMYNQQVVGSAGATPTWSYAPIKYWPNETQRDSETVGGTYDISTNKAKLSFFAYAPYIPQANIAADGTILTAPGGVAKTTGRTNITPINNGTATGDVKITYKAGTSKLADELLFGVAEAATPWTGVDNIATPIAAGMTFKNLVKPANNTTIKFYFKHALTRVGMTVVAARNIVDLLATEPKGGTALWDDAALAANKTKILIESISFNRDMHTGGVLNLNNTVAGEPQWENTDTYRENPFIINATHALDADLAYDADPAVAFAKGGVTTTVKSVMGTHPVDPADPTGPQYNDYYLLIPETTAPAVTTTITIVYHVMTQDNNLPGGMSDVTNTITKQIPAALALEKAKSYNFHLILGVNSVDLDVAVQNWTVETDNDIYLPKNTATP